MNNPYRNFDKGMDDAYMGIEPSNPQSEQYMSGYERSLQLLDEDSENMQEPDYNDGTNGCDFLQ
jgi:hypothetical protein